VKLFDSLAGELRDFNPREPGRVSIYVCGPTVQSEPHLGHIRSAVAYDLLVRWLQATGLEVTLVRNVTDIDDKVLAAAQQSGEAWWQIAARNEREFANYYRLAGVAQPTVEPRATGHLTQMIELIALLIERGHAYQATDGSGDVFFDTASWPNYGELTNQSLADMETDDSSEAASGKRQAQDFALWKARKLSEPESASWPSPWGRGRPGWHIECSAMATYFLGESFDIHGGGLDLRFPHHENELAQSRAAGHGFANYWLHNGLVTIAGQKMSKSIGNTVLASDLFASADALTVRYYLLSSHYRSVLDYRETALEESGSALQRVHDFLDRADRTLARTKFAERDEVSLPEAFSAELDDDLNLPAALAVLHETVREGNSALDEERLREAHRYRSEAWAMIELLALAPERQASGAAQRALSVLVGELIEERQQARAERNFEAADAIRQRLAAAGVVLEDDNSETHWSLD
jgi:cysteinyl-tRNA synthetase